MQTARSTIGYHSNSYISFVSIFNACMVYTYYVTSSVIQPKQITMTKFFYTGWEESRAITGRTARWSLSFSL